MKNEDSERFSHWFGVGFFQSSSVFCHSLAMRVGGWFGSVAQGGGSVQQQEAAQNVLLVTSQLCHHLQHPQQGSGRESLGGFNCRLVV